MHTDEYEISLNRELTVCRNTIKRIKEFFAIMERKHKKTTEQFVQECKSGKLSGHEEDFEAWLSNYESFRKWEELERQYQEIYVKMKI